MNFKQEIFPTESLKLVMTEKGKEIARVWVYFIRNDLHSKPYALIEDLFVQEEYRGRSFGTKMMQAAIEEARKKGCYKILATSRHQREAVHNLYHKLGFKDYGKEFRMDLSDLPY